MAPLTITYEQAVLNALLDDPDNTYVDQFERLAFHNRDAEHECLGFLRSLLGAVTDAGAWRCTTSPEIQVAVYGDFTCDSDGFGSGNGLTLQVFLDGVGICDAGIDSVWRLPVSDKFTIFDLVDGVTSYLTEKIHLLSAVLSPSPRSSNATSKDLADALETLLFDRGNNVRDWPEDERNLHRNFEAWTDFSDRAEKVQRLRFENAAEALLTRFTITALTEASS